MGLEFLIALLITVAFVMIEEYYIMKNALKIHLPIKTKVLLPLLEHTLTMR